VVFVTILASKRKSQKFNIIFCGTGVTSPEKIRDEV